jgi:hypothetical protein
MAAPQQPDPRTIPILARSLYRELLQQGFETREVLEFVSELLGFVTDRPEDP